MQKTTNNKEQRTHHKTHMHQRIPFMSDPRLRLEKKISKKPKHMLGLGRRQQLKPALLKQNSCGKDKNKTIIGRKDKNKQQPTKT